MHPVLIYTDHKNLEYLPSAKRLKPRQARWALFFSRFSFHITYRPGSKNIKPDALSRMHDNPKDLSTPGTILPANSFLLLQTDLLSQIKEASSESARPPGITLVNRDGLFWKGSQIFVPEDVRVRVLTLLHDHPLAGHFGVRKTLELVQRTFWWPNLKDFCEKYVSSCPICIQNKSSRNRAWGLLKPLPVPDRPWKMISMDFIVELPCSEGCSAIFVVVDRLTKMAHFLPLRGTPSAIETARIFVKEIIRLHGVPVNIVSDRGVQFTSRFWRALCEALKI